MFELKNWIPSRPVAFAIILCTAMFLGDLLSGGLRNPVAIVFYSFLPSVLWMMANEQRRDREAICDLRKRLDRLQ